MEGKEFLHRMHKGDKGVWESILPMIKSLSLTACYNLGVYDQLKDDIVQEVATKVFTNWRSYNCNSKLSVWIYAIAKNRCIDELRKMKVRGDNLSHTKNLDNEDDINPTELLIDHSQSNIEQRLCIHQMLAELESEPPARKGSMRKIDLIRWCVEHGGTNEKLAEFLQTSPSAAKERKRYLLEQLRKLCIKFCGHKECAFEKMEVN